MALSVLNRAGQAVTPDTIPPTTGDTGWVFPGSAESRSGDTVANFSLQSSTVGSAEVWNNPGNITASDGNVASASKNDEYTTRILRGYNFGFGSLIPTGESINGFELRFRARSPDSSGADLFMQEDFNEPLFIINDGGLTGKGDLSTSFEASLSTSFNVFTRGSSTELFGKSWTRSEIIDSDFGFAARARTQSIITATEVDYVQIKVHYGTPAVEKFNLDGAALDDTRTLTNAGAVDGQAYPYRVDEENVGWEVGTGIYRANSGSPYIERSTPIISSESDNSMVAFTSPQLIVDLVGGLTNLQEAFGV